jgi:wobble nucleotide-excising tRNase
MMLTRVISIKNVGRFRNSAHTPNPPLAKFTLIYGANGYGKTTLCSVLRSIESGDTAPLIGRKTLGSTSPQEIDLLFTDGPKRLRGAAWSDTAPKISVFDGVFVAQNVHSGDVVDIAHKRNLYRVIVGREGVGLAEEEQALAEQARATQTELTSAERVVQGLVPRGISLRDFLNLPALPDVDESIERQRHTVAALTQADAIRTRPELSPLPVPAIPDVMAGLLGKSIEGISADAEARLVAHLEKHGMQTNGERWLAEGMTYVADDSCPYCGRDGLADLPLVRSYQAHFSEAYAGLHNELSALREKVEHVSGPVLQEQLRTLMAQNAASVEFWRAHCEIDAAQFPDLESALRNLEQAYGALVRLIDRKLGTPLEVITDAPELAGATRQFAEIGAAVGSYNSVVSWVNGAISARKAATAAADLTRAQAELARLEATKRRHEPEAVRACDDYGRLDEEKKELERKKAEVREQLEAHCLEVVQPYESRINYYLDLFNAGFKIVRTGHGYPGGIATSTYQLSINEIHVELRDKRTPVDRPSFKNTLSVGDRATLALSFFLAHLERETDLAERIVVFDDPFSSQDAFRRHQTLYEIMRAANGCAQVVVLSHDANFLQQLWQKCPPNDRVALQIIYHPATGSKLALFDLDDACRGRARAELDDLLAFRATGAGNLREIIKKLRVVLETHFRSNFPGAFLPEDNLGGILQKVRAGGDQHPACSHYETLERINDYTANYHHGEDPTGASEPVLDQTELMGYVNTTLKIVNALPA